MTFRRAFSWAVLLAIAAELCGRSVARRSIVHAITGFTPGIAVLVLVTLLAGAGLLAFDRSRRGALPVLATVFCLGMAAQLTMGARLQSDGFYYYAYLRSLAFDRDVNFTNDYRMLGLGDKKNLFEPTPTGYAQSAWTIGPAIVWSPFFAAGHIVASALRASGADVTVDGTSYPYRQAVCVAGLVYGLLGCWFNYRLTRRSFPSTAAIVAVIGVVGGSFMLWYLVREPTMTHAPSMAAVAGFAWLWAASRDHRSPWIWAALGLVAGLMSLIRWQNALFMLLPGCDAAAALWIAWRHSERERLLATLRGSAIFLACAVLAFVPQMLAWKAIYGSYIARSPVGPAVRWTHPQMVDILWSARNGLFSTSPMLYLSAVGLVVFAFVRPAIGVPALLAVAVMTYFNACIQDWWGSAAFGGRRFDGIIPLLALGGAAFFDMSVAMLRRHAAFVAGGVVALFAVWNAGLVAAAHAGAVRIGETTPADRAWAAQAHELHRWFGNPFSYPVNLLFALRNAVPPGDYDMLATNSFLGDPAQPYGRVDIGADDEWLLREGWYAPEREGPVTFRWADAVAAVRVPLDHADTIRVQVRLHAFGFPGAQPQTVTIDVNGHACAPLPVPPQWAVVDCIVAKSAWRSGVNDLVLRFAWARRPTDVGMGGDPRSIAAAIDYVRIASVPAGSAP